jgi:hypothetical protein
LITFPQLRKTAYAIKDSTTIILPHWFSILEELDLGLRMMPRDVTTRWNSTYDMLVFAVEYREALESITGNQKMKLRQYELTEEDWHIAGKLRDVLKVCFDLFSTLSLINQGYLSRFLRTRRSSSRVAHPTSPPSSRLWITLTSTSQRLHSTQIIHWRSKPRSRLAKRHSTATTTRLIIPKSIGLQWVQLLYYSDWALINFIEQFYTLDISWVTLKKLDGSSLGSMRQRRLFVPNSSGPISTQATQSLLHPLRYVNLTIRTEKLTMTTFKGRSLDMHVASKHLRQFTGAPGPRESWVTR